MTRTVEIMVGALAVLLGAASLAFIAYLYGIRDEPPARPVSRTVLSVVLWTGVLFFGLDKLRKTPVDASEDLLEDEEIRELLDRDGPSRDAQERDSEA